MLPLILLTLAGAALSAKDFKCNFNSNDCGFVQRTDDDFDWTKQFGMTPNDYTGPSTDADGWGDYMYTDARGKPWGSKAKLETPSLSGGSNCRLSFYYHMYGYSMGSLAVNVGSHVVWRRSGDQGDLWHLASINLPASSGSFKVMFVGTIGGARSDMAIDDVKITGCSAIPSTQAPSPPVPPSQRPSPPPITQGPSPPPITQGPSPPPITQGPSPPPITQGPSPPPPTQGPTAPPPTQPPLGSCGIRPSARIVGGADAKHGDWPWQALLQYSSSGSHFCGGALVHPQWVVTASHCISGRAPSEVTVRMGAHKRTYNVGSEQTFGVSFIIMHADYRSPLAYSNDIALLKLDKPAKLDKYTNLVCLPEFIPEVSPGTTCWITGWGTLSSGGSQPETLQQASVPIVHQDKCKSSYPNQIDDTMICAGLDQGGVDACQGDSGGPMVCETAGRFYLHGATSWGYGCAFPNKYGVYARVKKLHSWLKAQMASN